VPELHLRVERQRSGAAARSALAPPQTMRKHLREINYWSEVFLDVFQAPHFLIMLTAEVMCSLAFATAPWQ